MHGGQRSAVAVGLRGPFRRFASSASSHGSEHHSSGSDIPWIIGAAVVTVPVLGYLLTAGSPPVAHAGGHDDHGEAGEHHGKPAPSAPAEDEPEEAEEESEDKNQSKEEEEQDEETDDAKEEDKGDDEEGAKKASQNKTSTVDGSVRVDSKGDTKALTKKPGPIKTGPDGSAVSLKSSNEVCADDDVGFEESASGASQRRQESKRQRREEG